MARIIPSDVSEEDFHGSYGEMQIYEALKKLPNEYIVFYSLNWHNREYYFQSNKRKGNSGKEKSQIVWGESDFTIFHPKKGIIVIEVKSGEITCKNGNWYQKNTRTKQEKPMKDPMVQAERSKYTFIDILEKNRSKGSRTYRVECAVWFPLIESYGQLNKLPPAYGTGNVLIKDDLENPTKAITRIFDYYGIKENKLYDKSDEQNVMRKLAPEFKVIASISNIIEEQEYYFNRMTKEQSLLIEYLDEQKIAAIQGGAGTGKTMLAIEKAKRLYENEETQNDKVLFLCFNEFLYSHLKTRYSKELPNTKFFSMDKLVKNHYKIKGEYSTIEEKLDFLNNYSNYNWDYKHIIVDEGQDFSHEEIDALHTISQLENSYFYIFYDKNQLVNREGSIFNTDKIDCRLILSSNCRNTKNIALSSNKILSIEKCKLKKEIEGEKPDFYITENKNKTLQFLAEKVKEYIDKSVGQKRIVILTVKTEKNSILAGLNRIGHYYLKRKLEDEKGILFTTARKYKGLEADIVLVIDIDKGTFESEKNKRVLHVAASRAKHFLNYVGTFTNEEKLDLCEKLTGKRNNNVNDLLGEYFNSQIKVVE